MSKDSERQKGWFRRTLGALQRAWQRWGPEFRAWRGDWRLFVLVIASALILRLAFPRWNLAPAAAVALAPFLWAVTHARTGKQAFYLGWMFGAVFYYVLLVWLNILVYYSPLIPPAILALAVYVGLFKGLFAWLMWRVRHRVWLGFWIVPLAWAAVEFLQSAGDLGFPWGYLGHGLWRQWFLIQIAAWTGVYGLSFVLLWANHLLCDIVRQLKREADAPPAGQLLVRTSILGAFVVAMFFAATFALRDMWAARPPRFPSFRIGIVQPNIPQKEKFRSYDSTISEDERRQIQGRMLSKTLRMTYDLQSGRPFERCDLVIWPESAITDLTFARNPHYATLLNDVATTRLNASLFLGADNLHVLRNGREVPPGEDIERDYARNPDLYSFELYNGAWLVEPGRGLNPRVYNKTFLVPFAEGIPYVQRIAPLARLISRIAQMEPFLCGKDHAVFEVRRQDAATAGGRRTEVAPLRFGPLICYESCYPRLSRILVRNGAEMLVILTNDAWYETTAGPAQHELEAIFRAVETRRWVARCANSGISCFVSPWGKIEKESELARDATLKCSVWPAKGLTFYARWGDLFAWFALAMTAGFLVADKTLRKRRETRE